LAHTTITSATTVTTTIADTVHEGFTFQNTTVALDTFTAGGETYAVDGMADTVFTQRGSGGASRSHVWYETASNLGDRVASYATTLDDVLLNNNLALGAHNLFANAGSSSANIERVDLISSSGFTASGGFAFPVFDFGVNPQHESFKIALVTGVDCSGNSTGFSDLAGTAPFTATNIYNHDTFSIHRYDNGSDTNGDDATGRYALFNTTNDQGPGRVVFTFDDFGVTAGTTIFGYSLFGYDVATGGDTNNLVDWTNSTYFPTATPGGEGTTGGFDFAAVNGIFLKMWLSPRCLNRQRIRLSG
jgi:hypothetical protein